MAYTPTQLYQGQLPSSETTSTPGILNAAVPSSTTWIVKEIILCNTSTGTTVTVSLSIVASGGTGGSSNRIISNLSLSPNQTTSFDLSTVMATGGFITATCSLSTSCTATISGVIIS